MNCASSLQLVSADLNLIRTSCLDEVVMLVMVDSQQFRCVWGGQGVVSFRQSMKEEIFHECITSTHLLLVYISFKEFSGVYPIK